MVKNSPVRVGVGGLCARPGFSPWVVKILRRRAWQLTVLILPGESHGQRSLVGYGTQDHRELDMSEAT